MAELITNREGTLEDAGQSLEIDHLRTAFEKFTTETSKLEQAYGALKGQFSNVNMQLSESNQALNAKVEELDRTSSFLNSILSNISQGLLFISVTGVVRTYNEAAEKILGVPAEAVLETQFWEHFEDSIFGYSLEAALKVGDPPPSQSVTYEHEILGPRRLQVYGNVVQGQHASDHGLVLIVRDRTDVSQLQELAQRNDRLAALGEMAAFVAHEIRNPLGGIEGFASLLARDLESMPSQGAMARSIVEGSQRLSRLLGTMLNYVRPPDLLLEKVDLCSLLKDLSEGFKVDSTFSDKITLDLILPANAVICGIDADRLRAAILNLLVNASEAMEGEGTLSLQLEADTLGAKIEVKDSGPGIPIHIQEKIFSPFFTTKIRGNGFGLSEVYKTVQGHGGEINLQSAPGSTCFTITLPFQQLEGLNHGH